MLRWTWTLPLLLAAPQDEGAPERPREAWQALPLPSLCVAPQAAPMAPRLVRGHHVLLPSDELDEGMAAGGVALPVPALLGLLHEHAAKGRKPLRLQPGAPPLLARGEPAALGAARDLLVSLDGQGRALEVEVTAWLTPGAAQVGTHPAAQVVEAAIADTPPLGNARVRSGATAQLGARRSRSFVAGYTVEIATGSGVAGPAIGRVLEGRTLHLRASRVRDGREIALEGWLDLAELEELGEFDPDTADLGLLQQPVVPAVQVAFGGIVASGGTLCVTIAGAPLEQPDWTLWVRARCAAAPAAAAPSWRVRDLAFLDDAVQDLQLPLPGAGFEELDEREREPVTLQQPLSPAEVAQAADAARAVAGRPGRTPIVWGGGLVLAPADEPDLWGEIDQLIDAAESQRLREGELVVRQGDLRVTLPVLDGRPARVLVCRERAVLAGYELQVAQDTWMPRPVVQRALDGLLVQGRLVGDGFEGALWRASSETAAELPRARTGLARVQLGDRSMAPASLRAPAGRPVEALPAAAGAASLQVLLRLP